MRSAELIAAELWRDPARMDTGSPEPLIVRQGDTAWVAYLLVAAVYAVGSWFAP